LGPPLLDREQLFVRVTFFLLHLLNALFPVHAFNLFFGPQALKVVGLDFGVSGHKPPQKVDAQSILSIYKEVILLAVHALDIVDVALIVFNSFVLLLHQLKSEECEKETFDESKNAHDKGSRVALLVHVNFSARGGQ